MYSRRHRSEVDEANLQGDAEGGLTIYIDNLPNDMESLRDMIQTAKKHIIEEEDSWFKLEQSDEEEELKQRELSEADKVPTPDSISLWRG